jgi:hypothetical protein
MSEAQDVSAPGVAFSSGGIRSATFNLGVARGSLREICGRTSTSLDGVGRRLHRDVADGVVRSKHEGAEGNGGGNQAVMNQVFDEVNRTRKGARGHGGR